MLKTEKKSETSMPLEKRKAQYKIDDLLEARLSECYILIGVCWQTMETL